MARSIVLAVCLAVGAADLSPAGEGRVDLIVSPTAGRLDDAFTIALMNGTEKPIEVPCCNFPEIALIEGGSDAFCPGCFIDCEAVGPTEIPPGGFFYLPWLPKEQGCDQTVPVPGIYRIRWKLPSGELATRVELLPDSTRELELTVEPAEAHLGEKTQITVKNTSLGVLFYNRCCFVPGALEPTGRGELCVICLACIQMRESQPDEVHTFEWIPGERTCNPENHLPGWHRVIWADLYDAEFRTGERWVGEASVRVLPAADRRVDLALSATRAYPGDALRVTATNTLGVSVWRRPACPRDAVLFIDELGRTSVPVDSFPCDAERIEEIPPGGSVSVEVKVPGPLDPGAVDGGLAPGRWSVVWGRSFALSPAEPPDRPVFGYAELTALSPDMFVRGDCDGAEPINLTDPIFLLNHLFLGGTEPPCPDACDLDDDGVLSLTDAIYELNHLFLGGPRPIPPFPDAGFDPCPDRLGCIH